ncbi:bifunctional metallophosphatase/5'-nucleotidase, partial [Candidatus Clostridium stratigraminis]
VEITDFHGQLLSSDATPLPVGAVLAQNVNNIKSANPDRTLVIGGGDLYQGTPISNVLKGVPVQQVMTNIGMEVTALGNHEFDWGGLDTINNTTMKGASYSIVCANLYDKVTNTRVYNPYKIITKDGVRIAVIGAITTDAPNIIMPAYVANYKFTDPITEINTVAKSIKDGNLADVIIADIHEGNDTTNAANGPITGPIATIADGLVGSVNAVFAGHSHTEVHALSSKGMPIYIAKSNGKGLIDVKMTVSSTGAVTFPTPSASDYIALDTTNANGYKIGNPNLKPGDSGYVAGTPIQDSATKAIVDAANVQLGPTFNEVIGTIPADLGKNGFDANNNPIESQLGNWASDAVKNSAKADIGVANNGGLRTNFSKGNVTVGQVFNFMPFDNEINTVKVNYAQLKAILEQAVMDGGKGIQISGIKFYYDLSRPNLDRVVKITKENGEPITGTLTLAGPDFVLTGGDGFTAFNDAAVKATLDTTKHVLARDAFIADIRANKTIKVVMDSRLVNVNSTISIVGTSDLHGSIYPLDYNTSAASNIGLARISTYMNNLRAANPNTMLIDNGDTIQGTPLVYYYNMLDTKTEYPMMKVMGAMKYDTWTLGNHEFNYGLDTLNRVIADAKKEGINVLSANTYNTKDNTNFVNPYYTKTFTINGKTIKVGILGLTTKTIPSWEDPAHYAGLKFNDLVDEAKKWVPVLKNQEKCDIVIVSAHTGTSNLSDTIPENQADLIAQQVSGIDVILAGHAHTGKTYSFTNPDGKVVPVVEPKNGDGIFSQIDINVDANGAVSGVKAYNVDTTNAAIPADQSILDVAKPYQDATLAYTNTVIGKSTAVFEGSKQLTEPSTIMELVNKVQMNAAKSQLSIAAPLSLTAKVPQGDIKRQDIMGVYVYENFLYGVNMTGKQLKNWMEWSVRYYKQVSNANDPIVKDPVLNIADYNLDQLYGATYDIDLTQPACTTDSKGVVISGNRIKNLKVNGILVKDTDVFKVAINNYRYNGGGGFMAAAGLTPGSAATIAATYYDSAKALGDDGQVRNMMF